MANVFQPMGNIPEGYDSLLNSARQQLVRLPDGTLVQAPQFGGATSLKEIYGGILPNVPSVPGPLKTRSVQTYDVDSNGNPIISSSSGPGFTAPTAAVTRSEQSGSRPAITVGTQPAGTAQMPPGVRPASIDRAYAQMGIVPGMMGRGQPQMASVAPMPRQRPSFPAWDPFGTRVANKDESRLPTNAGEQEFLSAFYPEAGSPAAAAIDRAAPNVPMPRQRPLAPAQIPLSSIKQPPTVPAGRGTSLGPITFKKGDTVWDLARDRGMTVNSFASLYGIADPSRIKAGQTVVPQVPMPRTAPPALRSTPQPSNPSRWDGVLDSFGRII